MTQALAGYFSKTIEVSLHASLIIGVLLLARPLIKRFFPARWIYTLWFIVIARLLLVDLPSFSGFTANPLPDPLAAPQVVQWSVPLIQSIVGTTLPVSSQISTSASTAPASSSFNGMELLPMAWATGLVAMLLLFALGSFRWSRRLTRDCEIVPAEVHDLLQDCLEEMKLSARVRIVKLSGSASPSITGLFRPTLILPENFSTRFHKGELRWIILHELAHLKRGDLYVQFLCRLLQAIHWFNPLVWIAFACLRQDRELACDEYVLDHQNHGTSLDYGHTLIKVAEVCPRSSLAPGFLGISEDKINLQERVEKIREHRRPTLIWIAAGIILCALLAYSFLTKGERQKNGIKISELPLQDQYDRIDRDLQNVNDQAEKQGYYSTLGGLQFDYAKLQTIQSKDPNWETDLITKKLKEVKEKIADLQAKIDAPSTTQAAPAPALHYYHMEEKVLNIPVGLQDRFQSLQESGHAMDILKESGVYVDALADTEIGSTEATVLLNGHNRLMILPTGVTSNPNVISVSAQFNSMPYTGYIRLGDFQILITDTTPHQASPSVPNQYFYSAMIRLREITPDEVANAPKP